MTELPIISRARQHANSVAFRTAKSSATYQQLLDRSAAFATALLGKAAVVRVVNTVASSRACV